MDRVTREKGFLYYVGSDGHVWRTKRGKKGSKARASSFGIKRQPGYLYYVKADGSIGMSKMKRRR